MNPVRVKFKDWQKRFNLWKHKFTYAIYLHPADAFMYAFLLCLFIFELVLVFGGLYE